MLTVYDDICLVKRTLMSCMIVVLNEFGVLLLSCVEFLLENVKYDWMVDCEILCDCLYDWMCDLVCDCMYDWMRDLVYDCMIDLMCD